MGSDVFLYLTTIGRKSGLRRRIEIWFVENEGAFYVMAERRHETGWLKNLQREPKVTFSIGTRDHPTSVAPDAPARARVVEGSSEGDLEACVSALMGDAAAVRNTARSVRKQAAAKRPRRRKRRRNK